MEESYDPLDKEHVPIGERTLNHVVGTIYTTNHYFGKGITVMNNFIQDHEEYMRKICLNILKNIDSHPNKKYRISIEGRGQASGDADNRNIHLALDRARFMRNSFYDYAMNFQVALNGEIKSLKDHIRSNRLVFRLLDTLPFYDNQKRKQLWADGEAGEYEYQRGKVNIYYEAKKMEQK